jgi:polyisoprenoid-binding protein YceI
MGYLIAFVMTFTAFFTSVQQSIAQTLKMAGSSKVWIDGTSTLHDWKTSCKGTTGTFTIPETVFGAKTGDNVDLKTSIVVPVKMITHEKEDLVENLQEAMEADKFPTVKYTVTQASIVSSDATKAVLKTTGKLNIHGIEKVVSFNVNLVKTASGMEVKGVANVNMKDHGIDPPTMMLGTIKTGKDVRIGFDMDLTK